jgi:hypothetical protein
LNVAVRMMTAPVTLHHEDAARARRYIQRKSSRRIVAVLPKHSAEIDAMPVPAPVTSAACPSPVRAMCVSLVCASRCIVARLGSRWRIVRSVSGAAERLNDDPNGALFVDARLR